jgi:tRNA (adenine22-N1)-methyltransferase
MNAGTRLETVAGLVPPCEAAADIGTDHGYVPALLIQSGRCRKVIASDIAAGPCDAARETVARFHLGGLSKYGRRRGCRDWHRTKCRWL